MIASAGLLSGGAALADNLHGVDRFLCATGRVLVCVEDGDCTSIVASQADVPEFVVVDVQGKMLSTTEASRQNRVTPIGTLSRADGYVYLQGVDVGRAYSLIIDEESGHATAAVSRDGLTVTMFAACTNADVSASSAAP